MQSRRYTDMELLAKAVLELAVSQRLPAATSLSRQDAIRHIGCSERAFKHYEAKGYIKELEGGIFSVEHLDGLVEKLKKDSEKVIDLTNGQMAQSEQQVHSGKTNHTPKRGEVASVLLR
jgi:hypothetical protein